MEENKKLSTDTPDTSGELLTTEEDTSLAEDTNTSDATAGDETTDTVDEPVHQPTTLESSVLISTYVALEKLAAYVPTAYVDNSEPDINADHLNNTEQGLLRVTNLLNGAVDVINDLQNTVTQQASAIDTLNSKTGELGSTEITVYGDYCKAIKKNGLVFVRGESVDKTLTARTYNAITTLPEEFRPKSDIYFTASSMGGEIEIFGMLSTSGVLSLYSVTETKYWIYSFMFPC